MNKTRVLSITVLSLLGIITSLFILALIWVFLCDGFIRTPWKRLSFNDIYVSCSKTIRPGATMEAFREIIDVSPDYTIRGYLKSPLPRHLFYEKDIGYTWGYQRGLGTVHAYFNEDKKFLGCEGNMGDHW